jgi:hypothetical protein
MNPSQMIGWLLAAIIIIVLLFVLLRVAGMV